MSKYFIFLCANVLVTYSYSQSTMAHSQKDKILIVLSNQGVYGNSDIKTANHFEETVIPYNEFVKAGYAVEFVSPNGGEVPVGYINTSSSIMSKYIFDCDFMDQLRNTKRPQDIRSSEFSAIFYSGGGAAMFGVPENKQIQKIAAEIYENQNGIVSAICHGTAGLANIQTADGRYLVEGKQVNGFPDAFENVNAAYYQEFPFSIENKMEERGAIFSYSKEGWDEYLMVDDRLITGQDPSSAVKVAQAIIQKLQGINN